MRFFAFRSYFLALVLACISGVDLPAADKRPNIILLLTDDMGYADVSCNGGTIVPTPNIDRMAQEGIRFTQYYSASPICSPSRTGILTGQYPSRWRILTFLQNRAGNRAAKQADFLDPKAPSMARTMKEAGYATGHFGKWHMGGGRDVKNAPKFDAYGFDEHASTWESPEPDPTITASDWIWSPKDDVKRWDRTSYFVQKTLDFLSRHKDKPCFVNLWPDDVHTPWVPKGTPDGELQKGDQSEGKLRRVLTEYDRQVGLLFEGLKKTGLDENTLVIFMSDNGAAPTFEGKRSGIYRDGKGSLHEGGIRMPFIVRWPGHVPPGKVDETTILHAVDLYPSMCRIAGITTPGGQAFDGEDMSPALFGKPMKREKPLYWEFGSFVERKKARHSPGVAIREGDWKLLIDADGSDAELFNLKSDPGEKTNLAGKYSAEAKRLSEKALAWRKTL